MSVVASRERARPRTGRGHAVVPHTADAGIRATAADLPSLFEEAAAALAGLAAEVRAGSEPTIWEDVTLGAGDVVALAYAWLNELVTLGEVHHGVAAVTRVERAEGPVAATRGEPPGGPVIGPAADAWRLSGRVGIVPYGDGARPIRSVKSATYHGLAVERRGQAWTMLAYLDI